MGFPSQFTNPEAHYRNGPRAADVQLNARPMHDQRTTDANLWNQQKTRVADARDRRTIDARQTHFSWPHPTQYFDEQQHLHQQHIHQQQIQQQQQIHHQQQVCLK